MPLMVRCSACGDSFLSPAFFPATCPACGAEFGSMADLARDGAHARRRTRKPVRDRKPLSHHGKPTLAEGRPDRLSQVRPPVAPAWTRSQAIWILAAICTFAASVVGIGLWSLDGKSRQPASAIDPARMGFGRVAGELERLPATEVYRRTAPAVLTIVSRNENGQEIARGSGFRVADSIVRGLGTKPGPESTTACYVLTNFHVIRSAAVCNIEGRENLTGSVVSVSTEDEAADLALLMVSINTGLLPAFLSISEHGSPAIGTSVYAIGNPLGLQNSLSEGIISAVRTADGSTWLQMTAPISPGSSGGPLVTADALVVGVTTATVKGGQNLNLAIPASTVWQMFNRPSRGRPIWKGSSLAEEEKFAYLDARIRGANDLTAAQEAFRAKRFDDALTLAESAKVPAEFEFLRLFTVGKCEMELASRQTFAGPRSRDALWDNGHVMAARRALEQARALNPEFAPTLDQLAHIHNGMNVLQEAWFDGEDPAGALAYADRLVGLAPRCADAYLRRAQCEGKLKRDAMAIKDLETAIALDPHLAEAHFEQAAYLAHSGDIAGAEIAYRTARSAGYPGSICEYNIGLMFQRAGNFERAIVAFDTARRLGLAGADAQKRVAECRQGIRIPTP